MEEPLTCLGKRDSLQAMDGSASKTKIEFEELDDKWSSSELNPLYLPTGFHEDVMVRENSLFQIQESLLGGKDYLFPFGIQNAEVSMLQRKSQGPLKVSANAVQSHSLSANEE